MRTGSNIMLTVGDKAPAGNLKARAANPVSYTHLDVYKRQAVILPHRFRQHLNSIRKRKLINSTSCPFFRVLALVGCAWVGILMDRR